MSENTWSRQTDSLAASNKAADKLELKSAESLVSKEMQNQKSIYNIGDQGIEPEPDITLTASIRSTNLNDGMIVESITSLSEINEQLAASER